MVSELLSHIEDDLRSLANSQENEQAGATHEETRPESDKDTRAIESTYLARGLAKRVALLRDSVAILRNLELRAFSEDEPAAVSALVSTEDDETGERAHYLLAPAGGGVRLEVSGAEVAVLTPTSPLGRALLGSRTGDNVEFKTPKGQRTLWIRSIH